MMKKTILFILLTISYFAFGIWEVIVSSIEKPSCGNEDENCVFVHQVYTYVIVKAILNLINGSIFAVFLISFYHNKINEKTLENSLYINGITIIVSILGLIIFSKIFTNEYKYVFPMHEKVLFGELFFFFTMLCISVGILILFSCCGCFVNCINSCFYNKKVENKDTFYIML